MQNPFVPMTSMYQTQLEASRRFTAAIFAGTEKIDHVLLDATHNVLSDQLNLVQSMAAMHDPQTAGKAPSLLLSKRPEWVLDCQRELISIFSEMQDKLGQSMRQYMEDVGQTALVAASAQEESRAREEAGFNPVTDMFSVWENVFREATSLASKNMEAATNTFRESADAANAAYRSTTDDVQDMGSEAADATTPLRARKSATHARHATHSNHGKRSK